MTNAVEDIRKEIDSVDRQIQDLLIRRGELAVKVGAEKRRTNAPIIRPDREAAKIRGLIERHKGVFPKTAIVRIWREMIGAVSLLQTDMKVAVALDANGAQEGWDMARDYFGSVVPMQGVANPLIAISMVREGEANFAVLPWPEDGAENPWWLYLNNGDAEQTVRVMARLPYAEAEATQGHPKHRALVLAKLDFFSSDKDHSFLLLDLEQTVSRARVVDRLKEAGMNALSIYSCRPRTGPGRSVHLVEIDSYIATDDARLAMLPEKLESPEGKCIALGGYPVLPVLTDEKLV